MKRFIFCPTSLIDQPGPVACFMLDRMQVIETSLSGCKLLRPTIHGDERGWFAETFNVDTFEVEGLPSRFVQDNQSFSTQGVLRGLHYQIEKPQGKLIRVLSGAIWDVAVDLRRSSPTFGQWAGFLLSAKPLEMLWIPEGFAHGFLVLSESAEVLYKTTDFYHPAGERCLRWDDPTVGVAWPLDGLTPSLSGKDGCGVSFAEAEKFS